MSHPQAGLIGLLWILALGSSSGCRGPASDVWPRIAVQGSVKVARIDNASDVNGSVTFIPSGEVKGPGATTGIVAGKFAFDSTNGPVAGSHEAIVQIVRPATMRSAEEPAAQADNPKTVRGKTGGGLPAYLPEERVSVQVPAQKPFQVDLNIP